MRPSLCCLSACVLLFFLSGCPTGGTDNSIVIGGFGSPKATATPRKTPTAHPSGVDGSSTPTPTIPPFSGVGIEAGFGHNAWEQSDPMTTPRAGLIAWLRNGKVYAAQGDGFGTIEEYAPSSHSWKSAYYAEQCNYFAVVGLMGDKLYEAGGTDGQNEFSDLEQYDPLTGSRTARAALPRISITDGSGRSHAAGGVLTFGSQEGFLVVGGSVHGTPITQSACYLSTGSGWQLFPPLPSPRAGMGYAVLENRLYLFGGFDSSGKALASMLCFDPSLGDWATVDSKGRPLPPLLVPRHSLSAAAVGGKLYAIGGADSGNQVLRSVEEYDPATNAWRTMAPIPTGRALAAAVALDSRIYVLGGYDANGVALRSVEVFCP